MSTPAEEAGLDDVFLATVDLLRRTGMSEFRIRYDEDDPDEQNKIVVWNAIGIWRTDRGHHVEACGAMHPRTAVLRLAEEMIDGGMCVHCNRPAGFEPESIETMPADRMICWYQYDPELKKFRRGCE